MKTTVEVELVNHPHEGERGHIKVVDGKISIKNIFGKKMVKVELENCKHGEGGCYAEAHQIKTIRK